ncbi:condensation domain-containing protein [Streptomyces monticola]|uniref:Condensation domain-containing protein n=1 Tax=Streptomyces monticola TaxID=2666263 RepID=A0ABW2JVB9_9ACTN
MTPAPVELPSSPAQEALWWIQHRAEHKDVYNLTWRLRVTKLDPVVLAAAWQLVVDRHEALRTGFARRGEQIVQIIRPAAEADVQEVVWSAAPAGTAPDALLDEVAARLHALPFDLESAPLARLTQIGVGPVDELLVTVHHSVLDGWALQLVMDDLRTAYEAVREHGPDVSADRVFTEPAVPYGEFGVAERSGPKADAEREFWTSRLRGARAAALLPDGGPGPRSGTDASAGTPTGASTASPTGSSGAGLRHRLSPAAQTAVAGIAQRVGCTPFAVQLAAVRTVLARGGAGGRTALGVVVANRMSLADQRRIGYCANTVLLADTVTDDEPFDAVVGRARDGLWESLPYQHVGFPEVFAELPAGDRAALGSTPPVLITHHGGIGSGLSLGGRPAQLLPTPSTSARCQLLIGVFEDGEDGRDGRDGKDTVLEIEYDTGQLRPDTVRAFVRDIEEVLLGSAGPGGSVGGLRVASRAVAGVASATAAAAPGPLAPEAVASLADAPHAMSVAGSAAGSAAGLLADWEQVLGKAVDTGDDFFELGGHSLQVLELVALVEERTGRELDVPEWLDEPTPRRMAQLLAPAGPGAPGAAEAAEAAEVARAAGPAGPAVLREGDADGPHLHLVHGAGVGRIPYRELADALPSGWRVTVSEDDGTGETSVEELAERYLAPLLAAGRLPDVLGGWSMGGLLAHAMAARIETRGLPCPPLVLLDSPVPGDFTAADVGDLGAFARDVLRAAAPAAGAPDVLRPGRRTGRGIDLLTALLRATAGETRAEALHARYALHARHVAAMAAYKRAAVVDTPTLLVAAGLSEAEVARWRRQFTGDLDVVRLPADHYALLRGETVRRAAELVAHLLPVTAR